MTGDLDSILRGLSKVRKSGNTYVACCPAHDDQEPSLSIRDLGNGEFLMNCHAGCTFEAILDALGLPREAQQERRDEKTVVDTYDYRDEEGQLLYQVVRYAPKAFLQRRPEGSDWTYRLGDTRRVPYRLPQLLEAVAAGRRIFVVEGEKDVHTLEHWGLVATCNAGGAGAWKREYAQSLQGAAVCILPDNDPAGESHAANVAESLEGVAASIMTLRLPGLPAKGDVTDWAAEHSVDELKRLVCSPPSPHGIVWVADAMETVRAWTRDPLPPSVAYPWPVVNKLTRGMRPGWLCFLAGYPGMGKTAAAWDIAFSVAQQFKVVLFDSLEMSHEELCVRGAQRFGLDSERLFTGQPDLQDRIAADKACDEDAHRRIGVFYEQDVDRLDAVLNDVRPDLLILDYVQLLDIGKASRNEGTTRNSHRLKNLARKYALPVLALSQLTRPQDRQTLSVPTMHDLKDSGSLEQDADQIVFVHRLRGDNREMTDDGRFVVAKARMGKTGKQDFVFDGEHQRFLL